jgi:hypothetical protein
MKYLLIILLFIIMATCKKEEGEIPRLAKEGKYYEAHHLLNKADSLEKDKIFEETIIKIEAEYKKQQDELNIKYKPIIEESLALMSQGAYEDAYKKVEPIYIAEKQYDYFKEIYPKIYKPYRNIQIDAELSKLDKIIVDERESDFEKIYENIYSELEDKARIHRLRLSLYLKVLKKEFLRLDGFSKNSKEQDFLDLETVINPKISKLEDSVKFLANLPEYQGKIIDEGLNLTKVNSLKISLYTNLLSTNFKNLESSARAGKEEDFKKFESSIEEFKNKNSKFLNLDEIKQKIINTKVILFSTMISQKMNALQNYSYRDADYQKFEDTAVEVNEIRERMSEITDKLPNIDNIDRMRRWSDEMPEQTWEEARDECKKMGKRLPSLSELVGAFKAGLGENWGGHSLWSSTYYAYNGYYYMPMDDGQFDWNGKDGTITFRCIR